MSFKGRLRRITIPATAGNVAYAALSPAAGFRWKLLALQVTLTCDATVASRLILTYPRTAAGLYLSTVRYSVAITASQTKKYFFTSRIGQTGSGTFEGTVFEIDPAGEQLAAGEQLYLAVSNGQAGDSYSGILTVLEMPE